MSSLEIHQKLIQLKPILERQFRVKSIGYFGSFANRTQTSKSDLDLLVEFKTPVGWDFFRLEQFLEEEIGIKVDLVTPSALKQRIKDSVMQNTVQI